MGVAQEVVVQTSDERSPTSHAHFDPFVSNRGAERLNARAMPPTAIVQRVGRHRSIEKQLRRPKVAPFYVSALWRRKRISMPRRRGSRLGVPLQTSYIRLLTAWDDLRRST